MPKIGDNSRMKSLGIPIYLQIEARLTEFLKNNAFSYGQQLPTEYDLMDKYQVSRTTIRKTLQVMEAKGLVSRTRGSGTFFTGESSDPTQPGADKVIGLVSFFFMDYIYTEILRGIEDVAKEEGYSLVIANSNRDDIRQYEAVERFINQNISGLIIEPNHNAKAKVKDLVALLDRTSTPVVTTHWGFSAKSVSTVTVDDNYAGRAAARYLLDCGHRDIGYIYKSDIQSGLDRLAGFSDELQEAGFPLQEQFVYSFMDEDEAKDVQQGYILTKKLLDNCDHSPTALFYFNDNLAIQGYKALKERDLTVPGDVSVLGFDNYTTAALVTPPLTTFEHPKYDLGRWSAKILIDEIRQKSKALPMKIMFEPKLVKRGSVRVL